MFTLVTVPEAVKLALALWHSIPDTSLPAITTGDWVAISLYVVSPWNFTVSGVILVLPMRTVPSLPAPSFTSKLTSLYGEL